jgi:CheY-like chemotaxis protein
LTIRTERVTVFNQDALFNRGIPAGVHVCLEVTDTGMGMDEETQARIFDPFFTTKGPGAGTGLGLSTVYGIVQQAHGQVLVDSKPGSGATFRVFFPAPADTIAERPNDRKTGAATKGSGVILLVEDSGSLRDLLATTLKVYGYTVITAASAGEALDLASDDAARIDLVVTDVIMAGMSGIELVRQLKLVRPNVKVLYMSGYCSGIGEELFDPETNFLQKPFTAEALGVRVKQLLAQVDLAPFILIAEEDESLRSYLRRVLGGAGYRLVEASNGEQACEYLRSQSFDVMIADLRMAEQDDQIAQAVGSDLKIILVAEDLEAEQSSNIEWLRADATLIEPLSSDEVLKVVQQLSGRSEPPLLRRSVGSTRDSLNSQAG